VSIAGSARGISRVAESPPRLGHSDIATKPMLLLQTSVSLPVHGGIPAGGMRGTPGG
jgi:hypothetical protein